jgi:hypothetical protein
MLSKYGYFKVTDKNGNVATKTAIVTVEENCTSSI